MGQVESPDANGDFPLGAALVVATLAAALAVTSLFVGAAFSLIGPVLSVGSVVIVVGFLGGRS